MGRGLKDVGRQSGVAERAIGMTGRTQAASESEILMNELGGWERLCCRQTVYSQDHDDRSWAPGARAMR